MDANTSLMERLRLLLREDEMPVATSEENPTEGENDTPPQVKSDAHVEVTEDKPKPPAEEKPPPPQPATKLARFDESSPQDMPDAVGTPLLPHTAVCPLDAIKKYPFKFVERKYSQPMAEKFFDEGKFWHHGWDVYYTWPLETIGVKPTFWLLKSQVDAFLAKIGRDLNCGITLHAGDKDFGLYVDDFPTHPDLCPRFLCHCDTQSAFKNHELYVPTDEFRPLDETPSSVPADIHDRTRWNEIMQKNHLLTKTKNKARKMQDRFARKQAWVADLKQLERFLGLRPPVYTPPVLQKDAPWAQIQAVEAESSRTANVRAIDVKYKASNKFEEEVVFISIDLEWYERDKNKITEIGISIVDTHDLMDVPPGQLADSWRSRIHAHHIRVKEHSHLRNVDFCEGAPEKFIFGVSEMIPLKEVPAAIARYFRHPFSSSEHRDLEAKNAKPRKIVLVGHDVSTDIRYLRALGYDVSNLKGLHPCTIDTASLFRALTREPQPRSLANILQEFEIEAWHLHNAGNDACYTLQAMLAIAIRSSTAGRDKDAKKGLEDAARAREADAAAKALARAQEESRGWSTDDSI